MYSEPRTLMNHCPGEGNEYTQSKRVCWMMTRHSGKQGCDNCPNEPEKRLAIRVDGDVIQKMRDGDPPRYFPEPLESLTAPIRIMTGPPMRWRIKVGEES